MNKCLRALLCALACLAFAGCSSVPAARLSPTPAATPSLAERVITVEEAPRLAELAGFAVEGAGPVAQVAFTPGVEALLAAYATEGTLRRWRLADGALLATLDAGRFGLGGAAFDPEGKLLATAAGAGWERHKLDDEYLGWQVWDTTTGEMIDHGGQSYDSLLTRKLVPSILISPDRQWILMVAASADEDLEALKHFFAVGLAPPRTGDAYVNFARKPEEDDFDVIAFDARGEFFAAADEAGQVAVFAFQPPEYPKDPRAVIERGRGLGRRPLALAFDRRRQWLAAVRGRELLVWELRSARYRRHLVAMVGDSAGLTADLAFNPSGDLLAVGTASGWQVWDVRGRRLLVQGAGEVYSVAFSPEGRLFAWGDGLGVVHLWGIHEE